MIPMFKRICMHQHTDVITKKEIYYVLGSGIEIEAKVKHCTICDEELFDLTLDEINLLNAYDKYKTEHGLLSHDEITEIRENTGLTVEEFAALIGCPPTRYAGYETGRIQTVEEDKLIRLMGRKENIEFLKNLKAR